MDFKKLSELTYEIDGLMLLIDRHQEETPREAIECLRGKLHEILAVIDSEEVETVDMHPAVAAVLPDLSDNEEVEPEKEVKESEVEEPEPEEEVEEPEAEPDAAVDDEEQVEIIVPADYNRVEETRQPDDDSEPDNDQSISHNDGDDIFFTEQIADDGNDNGETVFYEEVTTAGFFDDDTADYMETSTDDNDTEAVSDKQPEPADPEESDSSDEFVSEAIAENDDDVPTEDTDAIEETAQAAEFEEASDADIDFNPGDMPGELTADDDSLDEVIADEETAESTEEEQAADAGTKSAVHTAGSAKPFTDIARAFTINDKFRFRRELFGNSDAQYVETIDMLSAMTSLDEIEEYLFDDLAWDRDNEDVKAFIEVITNYIGMRHGG